MNLRSLKLIVLLISIVPLISCCKKSSPAQNKPVAEKKLMHTALSAPASNSVIRCGDSLGFSITVADSAFTPDSVHIAVDAYPNKKMDYHPGLLYWKASGNRVGQHTARVTVYLTDSLYEVHHASFVVLSDIRPTDYTYRVIATYPHDNQAYTQGLFYSNGKLYESTGLEGKSSIRLVDIKSGRPEKLVSLPAEIFAEGITHLNGQIFQITYKSQVGFIYDMQTLEQIRSFDYQIREGWGLTTMGNQFVMSDGSAQLYIIDPEFFTQTGKLEIYDNQGMVPSLNELEHVNGKILANVYGESHIVVIDPTTGKVTGKLNLQKLMPEGSAGDMSRVLNGIAWNPSNGHLYITGKNWPVLYEIQVSPQL